MREFDGGRPFPLAVDARTRRQVGAVESIVVDLLGDILVGTFLHGSAIRGGLRATSDVDLLAVVAGATSAEQRGGLVRRLLPLSGSRAQNGPARPIELTVVDQAQLRWLTFPPRREFRYGEWERTDYENGFVPESTADADLVVLVAAARDLALPLGGPPLSDLSQPVDSELLRRAVLDAVPDLMADLDEDTRNVLLTLARIWCTLDTGMIRSKDAAAAWCRSRLEPPQRPILDRCRELYLAGDDDDWGAQLESARRTATTLEQHIRQSST